MVHQKRRHFRIYYIRKNGYVGCGIEEYVQSDWRPKVIAFASVFIDDGFLAHSEIVSRLLDEYCSRNEPIKVKLTQMLEREAFLSLQEQFPNATFRRTRGKEVPDLIQLSKDALRRKTTIYEKL
jgi:hypothetical protein